jgi:WhiB family redox-sensing transcriptional regulator
MERSLVKVTDALCAEVDPELFFAQDSMKYGGTASYINVRYAKMLCARCPLTYSCLMTAVKNTEEYGIWGGSTPSERRHIHTNADVVKFVSKLNDENRALPRRKRNR